MDQHSRMAVLHDYKAGKHHVLVATDVAARGLDIKSIKSVVNYDAAKEVDTHVHRIGRTGRAGDKEGVAYTLITPYETRFAGDHCAGHAQSLCPVKEGQALPLFFVARVTVLLCLWLMCYKYSIALRH